MAKAFIAIQVGAVSFVDEGVDPLLDLLRERGRVNALFLATHSFDPGTASRQLKGHPLPDHGKQEYDDLVGGNFATTHPQFYGRTFIKDFAAPDYGAGFDILAKVLPAARARDMQVYCWVTESPNYNLPRILPGFVHIAEVDARGRRGTKPCLNNPDYRNLYLGLYEDYTKSYPIDGLALCSERQGLLGRLMSGGWGDTDAPACFCPHCREQGAAMGIDPERARRGSLELLDLFGRGERGERVQDGAFVAFWRTLLAYPEILAWDALFTRSQFRLYRDLYSTVKSARPEVKVGWHVMHLNSFSPFYRAAQDYAVYAELSDFLKLALYQHCAGPRFARFVDHMEKHVFRGASKDTIVRLLYETQGLAEAPYDRLRVSAFGRDYVRGETVRAVEGTGGRVPIYPGIGIDVPTGRRRAQDRAEGRRGGDSRRL